MYEVRTRRRWLSLKITMWSRHSRRPHGPFGAGFLPSRPCPHLLRRARNEWIEVNADPPVVSRALGESGHAQCRRVVARLTRVAGVEHQPRRPPDRRLNPPAANLAAESAIASEKGRSPHCVPLGGVATEMQDKQ